MFLYVDPVRASLKMATSAMLEAAGIKKPGKVVKLRKGQKEQPRKLLQESKT